MSILTLINLFIIAFVLILLKCVSISECFPSGAPESACMSLSPQHYASSGPPQSSPFVVKAFLKRDPHKSVVHVSIVPRGQFGQPFKGFIVQARLAANPSVIVDGQFFTNDGGMSKTFVCGAESNRGFNTWTHKSADSKPRASAYWIPPQGFLGEVTFKATIVASKATYWENQFSDRIELAPVRPQQPNPPNQSNQLHQPHQPPPPQLPQVHLPKPAIINQQVLLVASGKVEDVLPSAETKLVGADESEDEPEEAVEKDDDDEEDEEEEDEAEAAIEDATKDDDDDDDDDEDQEEVKENIKEEVKEFEDDEDEDEDEDEEDEEGIVKPVSKIGDVDEDEDIEEVV